MPFFLGAAAFCPLGAFVLSIKTKAACRLCLILLVLLSLKRRRALLSHPWLPNGFAARMARLFPFAFVALVVVHQIAKVFTGGHAVDFAIFSQAIDSISRNGLPITTLIGLHPVNFFTHHFAPVLYLIGLFGGLGIPGWLLGIIAQGLSLSLALYAIFASARYLGLDRHRATIAVTLFCIHPSVRQGLTWSIHDEMFALGFVGMAVYFVLVQPDLEEALGRDSG